MWLRILFLGVVFLFTFPVLGQTRYERDFDEFWNDVNENYAYFKEQQIDWNRVKELYGPQAKLVRTDAEFIAFLEGVINELHNGHISLNTNLSSSNRIIPSGQDVFVEKVKDKYIVTDIRKGFGADNSGIRIGDEVLLFQGKPIPPQVERFLPKYTTKHTPEMYQYALSMLFAGTHNVMRQIVVDRNGKRLQFYPDSFHVKTIRPLVEASIVNPKTISIKINDALGDLETIALFDSLVDQSLNFKNMVIDLTETPSGGNTTVARCILGRFITKTVPYQQHEFDENDFQTQRKWVEYVVPRKKRYTGRVYVLVGRWTGSMGEGMAIGFDAMKRVKVIGSEMAKLLGAIDGFELFETKIGFQIPTERLYHVNGTPREKYQPKVLTKNIEETIKKMESLK